MYGLLHVSCLESLSASSLLERATLAYQEAKFISFKHFELYIFASAEDTNEKQNSSADLKAAKLMHAQPQASKTAQLACNLTLASLVKN